MCLTIATSKSIAKKCFVLKMYPKIIAQFYCNIAVEAKIVKIPLPYFSQYKNIRKQNKYYLNNKRNWFITRGDIYRIGSKEIYCKCRHGVESSCKTGPVCIY